MWKDAGFVFDSNVILGLYDLTDTSRDDLFALLDRLASRIWAPHQVAAEFLQNRPKVLAGRVGGYKKFLEEVKDAKKRLEDVTKSTAHPTVHERDLVAKAVEALAKIEKDVESGLERVRKPLEGDVLAGDALMEKVSRLLAGRIGSSFSQHELEKLYAEAETRFAHRIPPGFADRGKESVRRFGDVVLWKQIIAFAIAKKKPIIFVTNDAKGDWWWMEGDKTMGPLPGLRREFRAATGQEFYAYTADQFVAQAKRFLSEGVEDKTAEELRALRQLAVRQQAVREAIGTIITPEMFKPFAIDSEVLTSIGTVSNFLASVQSLKSFQDLPAYRFLLPAREDPKKDKDEKKEGDTGGTK